MAFFSYLLFKRFFMKFKFTWTLFMCATVETTSVFAMGAGLDNKLTEALSKLETQQRQISNLENQNRTLDNVQYIQSNQIKRL
jgi:Na+/H+ antiporter NhaB